MKYTVILEKGRNSFAAYVPDIPGCIAVGITEEETLILIKDSIQSHISKLQRRGYKLPEPKSFSASIEIEK